MQVPKYNQRDSRWSSVKLGTGNGTIGQYGCGIASLAMVQSAFGAAMDPVQVNDAMKRAGGFVNGDIIDWFGTSGALPDAVYSDGVSYAYGTPADICRIKRHLDAGGLCILEVRFGGNKSLMHFVTAIGYNGNDIIFNDPWFGDQSSFTSKRFGMGNSADDIWAIRFYTPKKEVRVMQEKTIEGQSIEHWYNKYKESQAATTYPVAKKYVWQLVFRDLSEDEWRKFHSASNRDKVFDDFSGSAEREAVEASLAVTMKLTGAKTVKELGAKVQTLMAQNGAVVDAQKARDMVTKIEKAIYEYKG